jgi:hypothetical protein
MVLQLAACISSKSRLLELAAGMAQLTPKDRSRYSKTDRGFEAMTGARLR